MKLLSVLFIVTLYGVLCQAEESGVYLCQFKNSRADIDLLRMKKYFDPDQDMSMGRIDLLKNSEVVESLVTQVLQIPLLDSQSFVQIWLASSSWVDAQLSYDQGLRPFSATYKKNSERYELFCSQLPQ